MNRGAWGLQPINAVSSHHSPYSQEYFRDEPWFRVILRAATYCHGDIAHICLELSTAQGLNQHCHLFNNHCQIPENITYSSSWCDSNLPWLSGWQIVTAADEENISKQSSFHPPRLMVNITLNAVTAKQCINQRKACSRRQVCYCLIDVYFSILSPTFICLFAKCYDF